MSITSGQNAVASDFINQAAKNATPANDAGRVPKLESDGKLAGFFTKNGQVLTAGATINGDTLPVPVYQNKTDNEVYACDANDTAALRFIGFAISNGTNGNPITVQASGVVGGFSGLDEGEKYYVTDTAGTISKTPGTYEVLVGIAISQTELVIMKGKRRRNGITTFSDAGSGGSTQSTAVTLGFRPSVIRVIGAYPDVDGGHSIGTWINGAYACVHQAVDESGGSNSVGADTNQVLLLSNGSGQELWEITITSVTDTGFTFFVTQGIASPESITIAWEAEGEL